jgi:hypothetical protein
MRALALREMLAGSQAAPVLWDIFISCFGKILNMFEIHASYVLWTKNFKKKTDNRLMYFHAAPIRRVEELEYNFNRLDSAGQWLMNETIRRANPDKTKWN